MNLVKEVPLKKKGIFNGPPLNNIVQLNWLTIQGKTFFRDTFLLWRQSSSRLLKAHLVCRPGVDRFKSNVPV
jgi:hypothetical protein